MPEMEFGPADIPERKPDLSLYERLQDITTGLNKVEAILQKNDARLAIGAAMDSDDWTSAALRYTECVARFSPTEVHELLADVQRIHPRPKLYTTSSDRGEITNAAFDNSYFNDTILYESPTVKGIPLEDAKLERLALHLEAVKQLERNGSSGVAIGRLEIKEAGEFLLKSALKLDKKSMNDVLKRASDISYRQGHSLNVVFADLDGDGKCEELSDVAVTYIDKASGSERIDLYDPPLQSRR